MERRDLAPRPTAPEQKSGPSGDWPDFAGEDSGRECEALLTLAGFVAVVAVMALVFGLILGWRVAP